MLYVHPKLFAALDSIESLREALQQAIQLEHSTIPPYLTALYSLKQGSNSEIAERISDVVVEEMLHMALACNLLNAVGGTPVLDSPEFIPSYPGPLPGTIANGLIVPLERFSRELVKEVFMEIEEPERPLQFPVAHIALAGAAPKTIGQFYRALRDRIVALGDAIFTGDPARQVLFGFLNDELIAVKDVASAVRAIDTIVEQGEGTSDSPLDLQKEIAHYYSFAEIYHGRMLVPNPDAALGGPNDQRFHYAGDPIPFDASSVWPLRDNPKSADYPQDSDARRHSDNFNYTYTSLLKALHATFNGQPNQFGNALGLMFSLKNEALQLVEIPLGDGTNAGPTFEYLPVNP